ncbi:trimeric intracellular cation channel family protein [Burkholderia sp. Z1]|uniref:trimeric intracellular cation channel family protein n=1 Tax=Burkholderia sp. Z1 TaxID=2759039 RepID=UPI0018695770|nr:trimeric intracellular cation channel family protein [Burkholderia sp. Z1]
MKTTTKLVLAADLAGTAVFAIEGAVAAMRGGLDLLGVMVIAFTVALGGGVVRDLLIGAAPPSAIRDWRYPALAFTMGLVTFVSHAQILGIPDHILIALDAAGLALFAVAGAQKAVEYGIGPFIAALMGTVTGVGGGVVRDLLLARVPMVLVSDIYASAAFVGGALVVAGRRAGLPPVVAAMGAGIACFALRLTAVRYGWHLPRAQLG